MSKQFLAGQVRDFAPDVEHTRTVEFVASTATRDRHRTVLNQQNWRLDNFSRNPVIGYQHNVYGDECNPPNPDDVIGKGAARMEGGQLIVRITFEPADLNPLAEKVFRKVMFGTLNAVSVGFTEVGQGRYGEGREARGGPEETYYFEGQELLEVSVVNIPSNPDAVKRHLRDSTARAMMFIKRALPEFSFSDIERLTVGEVVRSLGRQAGEELPPAEALEVTPEAATVAEELVEHPGDPPPTPEPAPLRLHPDDLDEIVRRVREAGVPAAEVPASPIPTPSLADVRATLRAAASELMGAPTG